MRPLRRGALALAFAGLAALAPGAMAPAQSPPPPSGAPVQLGPEHRVLRIGQFGLHFAPDMHMAVRKDDDGSYQVYITGLIGASTGSTAVLRTHDFLTYEPAFGGQPDVQEALAPTCLSHAPDCLENFDADYAGANAVWKAHEGSDLLMMYHGETRAFGGVRHPFIPFYAGVGMARSSDNGATWRRMGEVISGTDPLPPAIPASVVNGIPEGTAIVTADYIYVFFAYFPSAGQPDRGPSTIQVARAPIASDGAPGSWTKYYDGSFGTQPGMGGKGSSVLPHSDACVTPRQPWVTRSTYLKAYVMIFVCSAGWFQSTSTDLVNWTAPVQFYAAPVPEFTRLQETDENVVLVTPGMESNQTIGKTGFVLYAKTPAWAHTAHVLWRRSFTFP
jgi:hypothetical protein